MLLKWTVKKKRSEMFFSQEKNFFTFTENFYTPELWARFSSQISSVLFMSFSVSHRHFIISNWSYILERNICFNTSSFCTASLNLCCFFSFYIKIWLQMYMYFPFFIPLTDFSSIRSEVERTSPPGLAHRGQ